jgi:hypothetical protein
MIEQPDIRLPSSVVYNARNCGSFSNKLLTEKNGLLLNYRNLNILF